MNALNLTSPSVTASSLLILSTSSFKDFVIGPCLAVASTICQTELLTDPNEVSILSLSPSLNIAYKAGHSAFKAILAQAGDCLESPRNANST